MKKQIKTIITGFALAFAALQVSAKAPMVPVEDGGKMPNQFDTTDVPKEVRVVYLVEYPAATEYAWYGYPAFTDESAWYIYDDDSYVAKGGNPEYYVNDFKKDETRHKVVYSKSGKKVATHRSLKSTSFPLAVTNAFDKSTYKNWNVVGDKVEITKEADKTKVYKITVEKGKEKRALFYDSKGKLLKDKKCKV